MNEPAQTLLPVLLLLSFFIPVIFFLITQQRILQAIRPGNRLMRPGNVWLQLIPFFNFIWQFVVVSNIAGSIKKEFETWENDSITGLPSADIVSELGKRPTYAIGILSCSIWTLYCLMAQGRAFIPPLFSFVVSLAAITCWIIYWVKLASYSRRIKNRYL